ncbi:Protein kinase of the Mitotic Exit Network [Tilletia horrida]|uniref:Protein kinase of the Mitotic Exit Network n=1 Tax=Tilletia horrida TaxID=155126 RepID=A0AAN6JNJ1_9BASI|nr:Protein kinase of the Mitotic Exit Network [Tilletia horrida]KAK0564182.1 Protein kinase of the Mitotic Exit Network [Tilletia horrida]
MTAISAPPGDPLHFPLLNLGASTFSDAEAAQRITIASAAALDQTPPRQHSSPRAPSRLSSLHSRSTVSLSNSSPSKTIRSSGGQTTREASMTEISLSMSTSTPLKPEVAPAQEKVLPEPPTATKTQPKKMSDKKRGKKQPPQSLYTNPALASLSTPELHLASEPLTGLEEQKPDARLKQRWQAFLPSGRHSPTTASAAAGYTSIDAVMNSSSSRDARTPTRPAKESDESTGSSTARQLSANGASNRSSSPENETRDSSPSRTSAFFRRQRRWSATASPLGEPSSGSSGSGGLSSMDISSSQGVVTADDDLTKMLDEDEPFTPSAFTVASTKASTSTAATTLPGAAHSFHTESADSTESTTAVSRESVQEAAAFMYRELSRLSNDDYQRHKGKLARLGKIARSRTRDGSSGPASSSSEAPQNEYSSFWFIIADGSLLCALVRQLAPDAAKPAERLKSSGAHLNYFLTVARDVFGLDSKDLFYPKDVVALTTAGVQRVVHTILTLQDRAASGAARESSPPVTPISCIPEGGEPISAIPFPTDVPIALSSSPHRRSLPAIQHQRLLAERKLMGHRNDSGSYLDGSRQRKISEISNLPKMPSVQIVEPVREDGHSSNHNSSIYRDRKMSESVASLSGVVEEESEAADADISNAFSSPDVSMEFSRPDRAASPLMSLGSPNGRSSSHTRRLNHELGLGHASARPYRTSFDGASDALFSAGNGSPRLGPVRRHSSVARSPGHGPSSLNPQREFSAGTQSDVGLDATPRVPFPRSTSNFDSPSRRTTQNGRFASMTSAMSTSDVRTPQSDVGVGTSSSPVRTRPPFRHHRYSSDLHLPTHTHSSGNARSDVSNERGGLGRPRVDSEVGSVFTSTSFATQEDGSRPKLHRDMSVASKHKLVVLEGETTVTYQIGQCIGRGQFGSVYKALNTTTGMMLAVKRIKLTGKSEKEIMQLMKEVDLLKKLEHPSVVKYEGLVRTNDVLSIILEWVESGSLYLTLKNFGPFGEGLCASYVVQILEGLHYLHNRQVVHCDLKAANILTTKKGNIKLSDFGVSLNLQAMENIATRKDAVGTPNWMAPEVIELQGASTASDIWSLGCTIIEMLTGKPPYHDHNGLSAMYRIVEDDCPPIPPNVSDPLRDFLRLCFQKEPTHRPSAEVLFEHQWLKRNWTGHKQLRTKDSVPFLRRISADMRRVDVVGSNEMERSTSSPPATMAKLHPEDGPARPSVYRAHPVVSSAAYSQSMDNVHALPSPAMARMGMLPGPLVRHASDAESYFGHGQMTSTPSPNIDQNGFINPSLLDLEQPSPQEQVVPHQFVKISFSKAVLCKMCWSHVKKHAVYCEGCGVVCHPSCASASETNCPARIQVSPAVAEQTAADRRRAAASARSEVSTPTSPSLGPTMFRIPFIRNRRNSSAIGSTPSSPAFLTAASPPLLPSSPVISADGSGGKRDGSGKRRRRISLAMLGRQRSISPGLSSPEEVLRSPSEVSARNFPIVIQPLPASIVELVGSMSSSGSSTGSRAQGGVSEIVVSPNELVTKGAAMNVKPGMVSTPQLVTPSKGILEGVRVSRRLSVGIPYGHAQEPRARGHHAPAHSVSVVYDKRNIDQSEMGGIMSPGGADGDKRRSKRLSGNCIIM